MYLYIYGTGYKKEFESVLPEMAFDCWCDHDRHLTEYKGYINERLKPHVLAAFDLLGWTNDQKWKFEFKAH